LTTYSASFICAKRDRGGGGGGIIPFPFPLTGGEDMANSSLTLFLNFSLFSR